MSTTIQTRTLLEVDDLSVSYSRGLLRSPFRALRGVSLTVAAGETLAVVGESGSGKSTLGSAILGTVAASGGSIRFRGEEQSALGRRERRSRGRHLQVVLQDPWTSLNPSRTVGASLAEPLRAHETLSDAEIDRRVGDALAGVALPPSAAGRLPAEFSGGQRQRIAIARALISDPDLVVCDEAVSSLDVSVQANVLNVLAERQVRTGCSFVFISHDLAVVRHVADRVLVLYRGRVMEQGDALEVCDRPRHPYTRALLAAAAVPDPEAQRERRVARQAARPADTTDATDTGCPFAARCPYAQQRCRDEVPALRDVAPGVRTACHFADQLDPMEIS
jgi:oligopeptide/dipeptide ABC transporter ATP-binding protein